LANKNEVKIKLNFLIIEFRISYRKKTYNEYNLYMFFFFKFTLHRSTFRS